MIGNNWNFLLKVGILLLISTATCHRIIVHFGCSGHGAMYCITGSSWHVAVNSSKMPTFAVVLNLSQLSWHAAVKPVFALWQQLACNF